MHVRFEIITAMTTNTVVF